METIVSFLLVIVALAAFTTIIHASGNMNKKSQERSLEVEKAAAAAEKGDVSADGQEAQMKINFRSGEEMVIPIKVEKTDDFIYFGITEESQNE